MKSLLGDLNKDGKMSGYEQARQDAIENNMREQKAVGGITKAAAKGLKSLIGKKNKTKKTPDIDPDNYDSLLDARYFDDYDPDKMIVISFDGEDMSLGQAKEKLARMREELEMFQENQIDSRNADKEKFLKDEIMDLSLEIEEAELGNRGDFSVGGLLESDDSRYGMNEGGEMKMLPDEIMEQNFIDFVVGEALSEKEESMLNEQLEANPELSVIFDKVVEKASEFTGAGPVEGPGTGTSDDIPARLSDGEFVFTAKAVEQIGADNLMQMMKEAEAAYDAGSEREGYANGEEVTLEEDDKKVTVEYVQQQPTSTESLLGSMPLYEEDESSKINKESMRLNPTRHVYS